VDPLTHNIIKYQDQSSPRLWKIISDNNPAQNFKHNKISKADELLQACKWPEPTIYPALVLKYLQEAQAIFELHRMPERVVASRIATAYIHCQLGEERNAIALATTAIAKPALLKPEAMARAVYVLALAHGRLGEIDTALQLIEGKGQELAQLARGSSPSLPALMAWAKAQMLWKAFLYKSHPELWCGPPPDSGLVHLGNALPDRQALLEQLQAVGRQLPQGHASVYSQLLLHALAGLEAGRDGVTGPIQAMEKIAGRHQLRHPPVAAWAWLSCALVHCAHGGHVQALQATAHARHLAQTYQLQGLHRNVLVYEYHIQEIRGDYPSALSTLKALNIMRLKSVAISPYLDKSRFADLHESRLRDLEPVYVKRALQYIEENIDKKLRVQSIADHCAVSRRTLEISFRNSRCCSIGDYIRQSKIHLAAESLLTTDQTIGQISLRLGYSSLSSFSRDFSAHYGIPPSLWIRHHRLV
jgi:AraC-like DNA-binding protein